MKNAESFLLILMALLSCNSDQIVDQKDENDVIAVVHQMNIALANHNMERLSSCYTNEMDLENSFGWTIRNKETLERYFGEWLFQKYPVLDTSQLTLKYQVDFTGSESAWIDVMQEIYTSPTKDTLARTYRQVHLLTKNSEGWKIRKTRIWLPHIVEDPPTEFLDGDSYFSNPD